MYFKENFKDSHSKTCNKVSQTVVKIEQSQFFDQINFKLDKILKAMESIASSMKSKEIFFFISIDGEKKRNGPRV